MINHLYRMQHTLITDSRIRTSTNCLLSCRPIALSCNAPTICNRALRVMHPFLFSSSLLPKSPLSRMHITVYFLDLVLGAAFQSKGLACSICWSVMGLLLTQSYIGRPYRNTNGFFASSFTAFLELLFLAAEPVGVCLICCLLPKKRLSCVRCDWEEIPNGDWCVENAWMQLTSSVKRRKHFGMDPVMI
jgi:hypothetical protein